MATERSQRWHIEYVGGIRHWTARHTVAECVSGVYCPGYLWAPTFVGLTNQLVDPDLIRRPPTADW